MAGSPELPARALQGAFGQVVTTVSDRDEMRWVTLWSIVGLAAAVVLVIIGGMPFDLPMPTHLVGWVDPGCGLTRGSTAIARGDFSIAWRYNPASFLVMTFGVLGLLRAVLGWSTRRWVNLRTSLSGAANVVLIIVVAAFWLYQQSNADFIINARV